MIWMQSDKLRDAIRACRSSFVSVGFFSVFVNILMLVPTFYMIQVSGRVVPTNSVATLYIMTILMTYLVVAMGALEWVRSRIMIRINNRFDLILAPQVYRASFVRALNTRGGDATAQSLNDLVALRQFVTGAGLIAFFDVPWLPIYIALMFFFHVWLGWLTVFCAAALILLAVLNNRLTGNLLESSSKKANEVKLSVGKELRNAEVIESMGMLDRLIDRWFSRHFEVLKAQSMASDHGAAVRASSKTFRTLSQSIALALTAFLVLKHELNPGLLVAGSLLLGKAMEPVDRIIGSWRGFAEAKTQFQRLRSVLASLEVQRRYPYPHKPTGHVRVVGLTVSPAGATKPILNNVNFEVPPGVVVVIVGPSGAGKSTLVRSLLGIYPIQGGAVILDEVDISGWDKSSLGPYVGYLPQSVELFEGSITENIARFDSPDPAKVVRAAKTAGIHEMVLQFPSGYDTVIGSYGVNLSGGQRQRIGLARAIYGSPPLIVLDEPNSNLDEMGELALSFALKKLKEQGCTVFVVSHRPSVVSVSDFVLAISEGEVLNFGGRNAVVASLAGQEGSHKVASTHAHFHVRREEILQKTRG